MTNPAVAALIARYNRLGSDPKNTNYAGGNTSAKAWGTDPVDVGIGGSIPFVQAFAEKFPDAAILVTGVEDPDTRAHGANESLHLGEFERVCTAEALLLARLGAMPKR